MACGCCGTVHRSYYDKTVRRIRDLSCGDARIYLEVEVRRVRCKRCGTVKREKLPWLANNPFYTKRFSYYVGRKCRAMTIKDVAKELRLDWHAVKALEKEYMQEQLRRNPVAAPPGNRDRRTISAEGAYLPDRGQRSGAWPTDLVWRGRPV